MINPLVRNNLLRTLQFFAVVCCLVGCGKKASEEIDFGTIKDSVYHNEYFKMTVKLPPKWSVQDQEAQRRLMKKGLDMVAADDRNLKAMQRAADLQTVNLFSIFEHPLGSAVEYNPSVLSVAERVRDLPGIKRGKDYLFQVQKMLEGGQVKISFPKKVYTEQLGGVDFDVLETEIDVRRLTVRQKYYATIIKGYALGIVISFTNDDEEAACKKVLETLTLEQPAK